MLVLTRAENDSIDAIVKAPEGIKAGDAIRVTIIRIKGNQCVVGLECIGSIAKDKGQAVRFVRSELLEEPAGSSVG